MVRSFTQTIPSTPVLLILELHQEYILVALFGSTKMGKNYSQFNHLNAPGNPRNSHQLRNQGLSPRRVWVKRTGGNPTTILVSSTDIIDDLKSSVANKFPNSLARYFDPADIQIQLRVLPNDKPQQSRTLKQSPVIGRFRPESSQENLVKLPVGSTQAPGQTLIQSSYVILEPDQNVWEILDEYFPSSMAMSDAFLIDVEAKGPPDNFVGSSERRFTREEFEDPTSILHERLNSPPQPWATNHRMSPSNIYNQSYHVRPHQPTPIKQNNFEKYRSASPNLLGTRSPPLHSMNHHKRSLSNPPQSPIATFGQQPKNSSSQAVLLLPKNFSLGDQQGLKRYSIDGDNLGKGFSDQSAKLVPENNDSNSGSKNTTKKLQSFDPKEEVILGLINDDKPQPKEEGGENPSQPPNTKVSLGVLGTRNGQDIQRAPKDAIEAIPKKSLNTKSKETTINTSTFEKVLPLISVLVVEDNSINQAILGAFLRKHKIHYEIAKNGQEAVDKWRKGGFHLVLMDIQLPVKSGIEATKEIRHLEKVNKIGVFAQHELANSTYNSHPQLQENEKLNLSTFRSPVIIVALTASSNSSVDKKNALTAGCNDFLTKPVNLVWLQNKITEWGCMQALIDFDAWRVKGSPQNAAEARKSGDIKSKTVGEAPTKKQLVA